MAADNTSSFEVTLGELWQHEEAHKGADEREGGGEGERGDIALSEQRVPWARS